MTCRSVPILLTISFKKYRRMLSQNKLKKSDLSNTNDWTNPIVSQDPIDHDPAHGMKRMIFQFLNQFNYTDL